jgi:hypothetical protein
VADTVVAQPAARLLGEAAWGWSHKDRKGLCGVSGVLLIWSDGPHRVPRAFRVGPKGGDFKDAWARALLSSARNRRKCQPPFVLLASWSPSKNLLNRVRDDGWSFVCPLKKNRSCDGRPGRPYRQHPDGQAVGRTARAGGERAPQVRRDQPADLNGPGRPGPLQTAA